MEKMKSAILYFCFPYANKFRSGAASFGKRESRLIFQKKQRLISCELMALLGGCRRMLINPVVSGLFSLLSYFMNEGIFIFVTSGDPLWKK